MARSIMKIPEADVYAQFTLPSVVVPPVWTGAIVPDVAVDDAVYHFLSL